MNIYKNYYICKQNTFIILIHLIGALLKHLIR